MDPKIKSLKIKTGVVKRTGKEKLSYRKEADQQRNKIEKMKQEGKDEADIKKMNEVRRRRRGESGFHCLDSESLIEKEFVFLLCLIDLV